MLSLIEALKVGGCNLFNILHKHIRNAENVATNCFKKQLDKFLGSVPDEPCLPHYYKCDEQQYHGSNARQWTTETCSGPGLTVAIPEEHR